MLMNPPTLPADYVPAVHADELVRTLQLILHATAPRPDDGGHHEAAYELAMAALKRVEARKEYEAKHPPMPAYQPRLTPVGCGDGNTYAVG
jgi:hypothetical protein